MSRSPKKGRRDWPSYQTVWRWHFYAGLFCIPFVIVLAGMVLWMLRNPRATLLLVVMIVGCSVETVPIAGGTSGTLTSDGKMMSQMQVSVFDNLESAVPIGRGSVNNDGTFSLVTVDGQTPLELSDGRFYFTIESVGAEANIPKKFTTATTTPLIIDHRKESPVVLDVPGLSRGM